MNYDYAERLWKNDGATAVCARFKKRLGGLLKRITDKAREVYADREV